MVERCKHRGLPTRWRQFGSIEISGVLLIGWFSFIIWLLSDRTLHLYELALVALPCLLIWARLHRLRIDLGKGVLLYGLHVSIPLQKIQEIHLPISGATWDQARLLLTDGEEVKLGRLRMVMPTTAVGSGRWALRGCIWISRWVASTTGRPAPIHLLGPSSSLSRLSLWPGPFGLHEIIIPDLASGDWRTYRRFDT